MTRWRYAVATDTGRVRSSNQDAVFADANLVIVADGMGGHAAGEVASQLAVDAMYSAYLTGATVDGVVKGIGEANRQIIRDAKENPDHFGMGTTLIGLANVAEEAGTSTPLLFHVGDSRCYQLRDGALRQVTLDHTVAEEFVRNGTLTPEQAAVDPRRHQLTRALGVEDVVAIDIETLNVQPGDRLVLCSDGLSNELDESTIAEIASAPGDLQARVDALIAAANGAGGKDNISAAIVEFVEVTPSTNPIKSTVMTAPTVTPRPTPTLTARRRRPRVTWRLSLAGFVFAFVAIAGVLIIHWYAYSSYYLANDNGLVAVYQGQPNGVLWFGPVKVLDTQYHVTQLRAADIAAIDNTIAEPSLEAALHYANYLHSAWTMSQASAATPTTTMVTTTTTKKKG